MPLTDELLDSRIALNDWGAIGVESLQVEDFAYAATYSLARRIAEDSIEEAHGGPFWRRWIGTWQCPSLGFGWR